MSLINSKRPQRYLKTMYYLKQTKIRKQRGRVKRTNRKFITKDKITSSIKMKVYRTVVEVGETNHSNKVLHLSYKRGESKNNSDSMVMMRITLQSALLNP